jgi:putative transcriptional regulator
MNKKQNRLTKVILETAKDMREGNIIDEETYAKITMRHLGKEKLPRIEPITSEEIRSLREEAHLSQAVFASCLNLTVGYISQLERGMKRPTGSTLALLNVIRRNGINAVLR